MLLFWDLVIWSRSIAIIGGKCRPGGDTSGRCAPLHAHARCRCQAKSATSLKKVRLRFTITNAFHHIKFFRSRRAAAAAKASQGSDARDMVRREWSRGDADAIRGKACSRSLIPRSLALCAALVNSRGDHASTRAEVHRLRAIDCAAKTHRDKHTP